MLEPGILVCATHLSEAAEGRCRLCAKPFCNSCQVEDIASEESFCSTDCRDSWRAQQHSTTLVSDQELLDGYRQPIRDGWRLWVRSLPQVAMYTAPIAIAIGVISTLEGINVLDNQGQRTTSTTGSVLILLLFAFGVALSQVVMTHRYSGLAHGNAPARAIKRFVPWLVTLTLVFSIMILGYLAFIVPGIYLALRLFWAEEFALVHDAGPIEALKQSWRLTQDSAGTVFGFQFRAGLASYAVIFVVLAAAAGISTGVGLTGLNVDLPVVATSFVIWMFFIAYSGIHAPEIVYLYAMRAERSISLVQSTKTLDLA